MTIPDYQTVMLPLLTYLEDQEVHSLRECIEALADQFQLTQEERNELLPSGRQATFNNRVGWARTYMKKAMLISSTKRGYFQITDRGMQVLAEKPANITAKYLRRFPEFLEFQRPKSKAEEQSVRMPEDNTSNDDSLTPKERMEAAYKQIRDGLANDLLTAIMENSPAFFEQLVVDLLVAMGYGGSKKDAGAVGRSGDGGIDGIIKEDQLGLDAIYVQAKRWEDNVGRPEIQKFAGALQGQRAKKGIFITTSSFTQNARSYVSYIDNKIVLIDGETLTQLMIDYNIGVTVEDSYVIKQYDSDYFTGE